MRQIKFTLLLGGIGIFYLSVTLLALTVGLIAEAVREAMRSQRTPQRSVRSKHAGGYLAVMVMAISLVGIWATLVTMIA